MGPAQCVKIVSLEAISTICECHDRRCLAQSGQTPANISHAESAYDPISIRVHCTICSFFPLRPSRVALSRLNSKLVLFLTWRLAAAATAALCWP